MANRINRLSAESIQDINDVKTWARDYEIYRDNEIEKIRTDISDLKKEIELTQDRSAKSIRLSMFTSILYSVVLVIVVILGGITHVISILKDMF